MPYTLPRGSVYPADLLRQKAQEAARHRRHLRNETRGGALGLEDLLPLAEVDPILGRTRIKAVLSWLPGIGTAKTRRILGDTDVAPGQRLSSLTDAQRDRLLEHAWIQQHAAAVRRQQTAGDVA